MQTKTYEKANDASAPPGFESMSKQERKAARQARKAARQAREAARAPEKVLEPAEV